VSDAPFTLVVDRAQLPLRMDVWLSEVCPTLTRRHAAQLCNAGQVRQNGRVAKKSDPVIPGATVVVLAQLSQAAAPAPELTLDVVYVTDDLVAVNKPAGLPCAALRGKPEGTLAGALLLQFPEMLRVGHGPLDPGLLHRLDTFTSGLVLAARNQQAFARFKAALSGKLWDKRYLAIVQRGSLPDTGVCDAPLAPDPKNRRRVTVDARLGQPCLSSFTVKERGSRFDLFEVRASNAYRHQVRAHLAHLNAPLIGDELYGGPACGLGPRHALHASYIAIPALGLEPLICPLPADLRALLDAD